MLALEIFFIYVYFLMVIFKLLFYAYSLWIPILGMNIPVVLRMKELLRKINFENGVFSIIRFHIKSTYCNGAVWITVKTPDLVSKINTEWL